MWIAAPKMHHLDRGYGTNLVCHIEMTLLAISIFLLGTCACTADLTSSGGTLVGESCEKNSDCGSGSCWDFAAHDSECNGKVCSDRCQTNDDCVQIATKAGAAFPAGATCGADKLCELVGTGLGSFVCA
jgi:hypothetical protein